jgi:hypothetical protein
MRFSRLAATVVLSLLVVSGATAATRAQTVGNVALTAPLDVRGFVLTADEPSADTFTRTPSFAWTPVTGAKRYEFQLASARTFASGAMLARKSTVSPAVALSFALPWISGTPYSLYARARAIAPNGSTGPWSDSFGFNMRWQDKPTPLAAPAGLVRWTPVDGATSYQVWYLDAHKIFRTQTNVADEREYYSFHQDSTWTGVVHWRIRAVRTLYGLGANGAGRNGLPATSYGPWSPTYSSTNTAFAANAPLTATETISDTTSTALAPAAHHLMPAFVYSGDTGVDGLQESLYRVYVSTDSDCVNVVFKGAITGGPAYAPRWAGTLALPQDLSGVTAAQKAYVSSGGEGLTQMADFSNVIANEVLPRDGKDADAITSGEDDSPSNPDTDGTATPAPTTTPAAPATKVSFPPATLAVDAGDVGPPIDLWDTDWPTGRYFWTVVPVATYVKASFTSTLSATAPTGATTINVNGGDALTVGDILMIGTGPAAEPATVVAVSGSVTISPALKNTHGAGDTVFRAGGSLTYRDLELPQDACASGRVLSFGKTSEPALAANKNQPYASGLSPTGKLVSAKTSKPAFYGAPLVSWWPAVAASAYEVQWSKTRYPFVTETTPILTYGTSATLPLTAGTWYYRVRGINLTLPAGARAMAWSDPLPIVVAKPKFKIVGGGGSSTAPATPTKSSTTKTYDKGAFSIAMPKAWTEVKATDSIYLFVARDPVVRNGVHALVDVIQSSGRAGRTFAQWSSELAAQVKPLASGAVSVKVVTEPTGQAVRLEYDSTKIVKGRTMHLWQYAFDSGTQGFFVTFIATPATRSHYANAFAAAAASFTVN